MTQSFTRKNNISKNNGGNGSGKNVIELTFQGKDLTKNVFTNVNNQFTTLTATVVSSESKLKSYGQTLRNIGETAYVNSLQFVKFGASISDVAENIYRLGETSGVFAAFVTVFESTTSKSAKLINILDSLGNVINNVFERPVAKFRQFESLINKLEDQIENFQETQEQVIGDFGNFASVGSAIIEPGAGVGDQIELFQGLTNTITKGTEAVALLGQKIFFFEQAFSGLNSLVNNNIFKLLIQQNIDFQEQLISTQASLVSVVKVVSKTTGESFNDPYVAINKIKSSVVSAIAQVRRDSLALAGLTSNELIDLFQVIASEAGNIGVSLQEVGKLTIKTAGALSTLGIPLYQARQEVLSILQGQITSDSVLAKTLGITSQMVALWKQQGTLVDNLLGRFEALNQGQSLVAKSIRGVTSNIAEVFQEIGRVAGEPLLEPIVEQITQIYEGLTETITKANPLTGVSESLLVVNRELVQTVSEIVEKVFGSIESLWEALKNVFAAIKPILVEFTKFSFDSLTGAIEAFATALNLTVRVMEPLVPLLEGLISIATPLGGIFLKIYVTIKVLSGAFALFGGTVNIFAKILPVVGEGLFLLGLRSLPIVNIFGNLNKVLGTGIGGLVGFASAAGTFPPILSAIEKSLTTILGRGSALANFAPVITQLVPQFGKIGQIFAGFLTIFPSVGEGFNKILNMNPNAATNQFLQTLATNVTMLGTQFPVLGGLSVNLARDLTVLGARLEAQGTASTVAARANDLLATVIEKVRSAIISSLVTITKTIITYYLLSKAIEVLIQNNKVLLDTFKNLTSAISLFLDSIVASVKQFWYLYAAVIAVYGVLKLYRAGVLTAIAANITFGTTARNVALTTTFLSNTLLLASDKLFVFASAFAKVGLTNFAASTALVGEGLKGLSIALINGTGAAAALRTTMQGLLATFVAILPALLVIGAVAGAVAVNYRIANAEFAKGNKILMDQFKANDDQTRNAIANIEKNRKAQEFRVKNGIKLSAEEYKENKRLHGELQYGIWLREEQIKTIDDRLKRDHLTPKARAQMEEEKKRLEALNEEQKKYLENIEIAPRPLEQLGGIYEQLALKAKTAEEAIKNSSGNVDIFKQQAQALIDVTKQQVSLGVVTTQEARRRLELVANNNALEYDIRLAAINAIKELEKSASDQVVNTRKAEQEKLNALMESGQVDRLSTLKEINKLELANIDEQIKATRDAIAEQEKLLGAEAKNNQGVISLKNELKKLEAERVKINVSAGNAIAEEEQKRLEASFSRTKLAQEQLQTLVKQGRIDAVRAAELEGKYNIENIENQIKLTEKLIADKQKIYGKNITDTPEFKELQNKLNSLEQQGVQARVAAGEAVAAAEQKALEARFSRTKVAQERLQTLIKQGRISSLDATREESRLAIETIDNQIRLTERQIETRRRLYGAAGQNSPEAIELRNRLDILKTQRDLTVITSSTRIEQAQIEKSLDRMKNSLDAQVNVLNEQISNYKSIEDALSNQKKLIDAQNETQSARRSLVDAEINAISAGEQSERRRQKLAQVTASIKLQALLNEQKVALQNLEIEERQYELSLKRKDAEFQQQTAGARASLAEAQAKLQSALADPEKRRSRELIEALQNEINAKQIQVQELVNQRRTFQESIPNEREIFKLRRESQQSTMQGQLIEGVSSLINSVSSPSLKRQLQKQFADILSIQGFGMDRRSLADAGLSTALGTLGNSQVQGLAPGLGRNLRRGTFVSDLDPELEDLSGQLSPGAYNRAIEASRRDIQRRYGQNFTISSPKNSPSVNITSLLSPKDITPLANGFSNFGGSVQAFSKAVDKIGKGGTINISVNGKNKSISSSKNLSIEDVVSELEKLAR